ncbi:MAG: ATP-binding protein, partial [Gammaproteobacteria bacterium]|nr:ATP-binding protein [Gammaproteobacteria bacterium]
PTAALSPPLWEGSPFPGLRPFTLKDAPIFFGRGRETDNLISRLNTSGTRFLAVIGASGSGKSSLVAAGLLPRLRSGAIEGSQDWCCFRFTPGESGDDPYMALAVAFKSELEAQGQRFGDVAKDLHDDPGIFANLVDLALKGRSKWADVLLFIDQFEELFTLVSTDYQDPFIDWLANAAKLDRVRIVVTMRADFYNRCLHWDRLTELLETGSYPLKAPGPGALYEMVARPADRAGLVFEEGLANHILDDTGAEPGALALMAFALSELYEAREVDGRLTESAYEGFNGVPGAIAKRAENTFGKLDDETQAALGHVFRELVDVDEQGVATRRRTPWDRVSASEPAARLISVLTDARLLVTSRAESKTPVVEVAHEALLRSWPRLEKWIATTADDLRLRRQITQLADYWKKHD